MEIIVKNYEHYNRSMGKKITSKNQYNEEMKKGGYVPFEKGQELARQACDNRKKDYDYLSTKASEVIKSARNSTDKKGKVHMSDRLIDGMKEVGVNFDARRPE
jgi:hypothetical protein